MFSSCFSCLFRDWIFYSFSYFSKEISRVPRKLELDFYSFSARQTRLARGSTKAGGKISVFSRASTRTRDENVCRRKRFSVHFLRSLSKKSRIKPAFDSMWSSNLLFIILFLSHLIVHPSSGHHRQ